MANLHQHIAELGEALEFQSSEVRRLNQELQSKEDELEFQSSEVRRLTEDLQAKENELESKVDELRTNGHALYQSKKACGRNRNAFNKDISELEQKVSKLEYLLRGPPKGAEFPIMRRWSTSVPVEKDEDVLAWGYRVATRSEAISNASAMESYTGSDSAEVSKIEEKLKVKIAEFAVEKEDLCKHDRAENEKLGSMGEDWQHMKKLIDDLTRENSLLRAENQQLKLQTGSSETIRAEGAEGPSSPPNTNGKAKKRRCKKKKSGAVTGLNEDENATTAGPSYAVKAPAPSPENQISRAFESAAQSSPELEPTPLQFADSPIARLEASRYRY